MVDGKAYKLVPKEPDDWMLKCGASAVSSLSRAGALACYRVMISAASATVDADIVRDAVRRAIEASFQFKSFGRLEQETGDYVYGPGEIGAFLRCCDDATDRVMSAFASDLTPHMEAVEAPEGALPLRINAETPSVIICANGDRISIQWREQREGRPDLNEYERAEAMAAFLVQAANAHSAASFLGDE